MPLVVPGLTSNSGDSNDLTSQWTNQLMGKKLGDSSNETVWSLFLSSIPTYNRFLLSQVDCSG